MGFRSIAGTRGRPSSGPGPAGEVPDDHLPPHPLRSPRSSPPSPLPSHLRSSRAPTSYQSSCRSTTGRSPATGRSGARTSSLTTLAAASPSGSARATDISCYLQERDGRSPSAYSLMARPRARQQVSTSTRTETAWFGTAACISLYASMTGFASERSRSPSTSPAPRRTHSPSGKALASRQGEAGGYRPESSAGPALAPRRVSRRAEAQPRFARKAWIACRRVRAVPLRDRLSRRLSNQDRSRAGHPGGHQSVRDYERALSWNQPGTYPTAPRGEAEPPERADLYARRRWHPPAQTAK